MSKNYAEVEGYPHLVRDMDTGALLNINFDAVRQFREQKKLKSKIKQRELQTEERLTLLENDISEIKSMISELIKSYK